jgi:peptide chain release factor 3
MRGALSCPAGSDRSRCERSGRDLRLANATQFLAQEQSLVEEAFAGDVIGVYDRGVFEIGDTLTDGVELKFEEIPSFAPDRGVDGRRATTTSGVQSSGRTLTWSGLTLFDWER